MAQRPHESLLQAVVQGDEYRAADLSQAGAVARKMLSAGMMATVMEDLTGFRWTTDLDALYSSGGECPEGLCRGQTDLMTSDLVGFRSMAGGMDGYRVTSPTHTDTPTRQLVVARYAAEAAGFAVRNDFDGNPRLLTEVSSDTIDEDAIRAQLVQLHLRILGEDVADDSEAVSQTYTLFAAGRANGGDAASGWRVVLTALLQSPDVLFY